MPTSSAGRTNSSGITLLEMIVVVAILGLVAGISFPAISAGLDSVRMVSATDSVAAFLNAAVTRAERRQQAVEVVISPRVNLLTLYTNGPGFVRELKLPDGIFVEGVLPVVNEDPGGERRFLFMPGGAVPGLGVQLANRRNGHRVVRLDPMTGFPRVESVPAK
jgi:prepilin-type N-terminal cleavage/methylation domain-containing protein